VLGYFHLVRFADDRFAIKELSETTAKSMPYIKSLRQRLIWVLGLNDRRAMHRNFTLVAAEQR